jgi:hypothetical protein
MNMNKLLIGIFSVLLFGATLGVSSVKAVVATRIDSPVMSFGPMGWGGWSCPVDTHVVGGGYEPSEAEVLNSLAWEPGASVGAFNFPTTPFGYTYGEGETGWIVQNINQGQELSVFVLCEPNEAPVEPTPTPLVCTGDTHPDGAGTSCVSFSPSGPAPRNDEGTGGQVLGASTAGQVLGATTLAKAGTFTQNAYLAIMVLGGTLSAFGLKGFKKAFQKA